MKLLYRKMFFISMFIVVDMSLYSVQVHDPVQVHRDHRENSREQVNPSLKTYNQPNNAYFWQSTYLNDANKSALEKYNPIVRYGSQTSAYLGVPKLGIIPEFRPEPVLTSNEHYDKNLDVSHLKDSEYNKFLRDSEYDEFLKKSTEQQKRQIYLDKKHEDLNIVARNISKVGQSLGMKSKGFLLPSEEMIKEEIDKVINSTFWFSSPQSIFEQGIIEYGSTIKENIQAYKDYYGPFFGPAFFKMADSVPQAIKSIDGFHDAMNYFFEVCRLRIDVFIKTDDYIYGQDGTWKNYVQQAFTKFLEMFTRKFGHEDVVNDDKTMDIDIDDYDTQDYDLDAIRL